MIQEAAGRMRPLERKVLLLSSAEGLTYEQTGARLGYSVKRVERILARAIVNLARNLDDVQTATFRVKRFSLEPRSRQCAPVVVKGDTNHSAL